MKKLITLIEGAEIGLLKSRLEEAGIACMVRNEEVGQTIQALPFNPELWVVQDEDYPRAQELIKSWRETPSKPREAWTCPSCGEQIEGQFDSCWRCGAVREPGS